MLFFSAVGLLKSTGGNSVLIPVWEQLATDQTDPWQVAPIQEVTPFDCLLSPVAFVVLCSVGCLWVTIHVTSYNTFSHI